MHEIDEAGVYRNLQESPYGEGYHNTIQFRPDGPCTIATDGRDFYYNRKPFLAVTIGNSGLILIETETTQSTYDSIEGGDLEKRYPK